MFAYLEINDSLKMFTYPERTSWNFKYLKMMKEKKFKYLKKKSVLTKVDDCKF